MRNNLKNLGVCLATCVLFVFVGLAQQQLVVTPGGIELLTGATLPPSDSSPLTGLNNGPFFPPDPEDIPALTASLNNGPFFPPDPEDIPALTASLNNGPFFPPDPEDIPALTTGLNNGPFFPPDPEDIPAATARAV